MTHNAARLSALQTLLLFLVASSASPLLAATFEWNDPTGGDWDDAANWTLTSGAGTAPPGIGDTAQFDIPNVYLVDFDFFNSPATWDLDRILTTGGLVTIDGAGGNPFGKNTFINLQTGLARVEVNGGHLIFDDSPNHNLRVTMGNPAVVDDGVLQVSGTAQVSTPGLSLATTGAGTTGELMITGGSFTNSLSGIANSIGLNGATGLLTMTGGSASFAGDMRLALSANSTTKAFVTVSNSALLSLGNLVMGGTVAGADATINLSNNAQLIQAGASTLSVGGTAGAGVINIQDNALLDTGTGNVTINSTGDINLSGGTLQADGFLDFQGGRLDMTGGELVINNGMNAITPGGVFAFNGGTVRVQGGLAVLETSLNYGGPSALERAQLIIHNGNNAQVQFATRIGNSAGTFGRLEVDGVGSSLVGTGGGGGADLIVGGSGDGELEVTDGGFVSFRDDFIIANSAGSNGTALVKGETGGTRSTVDVTIGGSGASISIGQASTGTLDIVDGGLVQGAGDVFLASQATGNATITIGNGSGCGGVLQPACSSFGATLQSGDDVWVGGGSTTAGGTAELNVNAGGLVVVPDLMRIYAGGTVNLNNGRIELSNLEVQGGTIDFTGGELHFTGSMTFDASLATAIEGVSGTFNEGLISVVDALTMNAPFTVDTVSINSEGVTATTLNVNAALQHDSGRVVVNALNLSAIYTLDGGTLSLTSGTNVATNLNYLSGGLILNANALTVGAGGLLGTTPSFGAGQIVTNHGTAEISGTLEVNGATFNANDATNILTGGELRILSGQYLSTTGATVANGGNLQINGGLADFDGTLLVENGGTASNAGTLRPDSLIVDAGGSITNTGLIQLNLPTADMLSGAIDNQNTISLASSTINVPATGLSLSGGGDLTVGSNAALTGNTVAVVNNIDNRLLGSPVSNRLTLRDMQLVMGPTALIGGGVDLENVDLVDGSIDTNAVGGSGGTNFLGSSTLDGTVDAAGGVGILGLQILPTGELIMQPTSLLSISATTLDLDGRLRAEAGAIINLGTPGTYDWTGGTLSLADDSTHTVDPAATVILTTPMQFDNLTVVNNSTGFMRALYGTEPTIAAGDVLEVAGTTTLDRFLIVDGGTFRTGFLSNYENLDLRSGNFHLTADDFLVTAGGAGPVFTIGDAVTMTVDESIEITAGNRLVIASGEVASNGASGTSLNNSGDLDVIEGIATFAGTATNSGDINAIDSVLNFPAGLTNNGQLNLINTTVNGSVSNSATVAVAGLGTFAGDVTGSGDFTGSGTAVFAAELAPGDSLARINFAGDVTLEPTSTLAIEIAGLTAGSEFDQLSIAGDLNLGGDLIVSLLGGFTLGTSMEFVIAEIDGTLTGTFAGLADGALVGNFGGTDLFIDYDGGDGNDVALFTAGLPGDFDNDGDVDGADFLVWQRDPNVGLLTDWQTNYGTTAPLAVAATTVPEPHSVLAILLASLSGIAWRRCRFAQVPC